MNRTLLIAAAALFLLSFFSYRNSVERAERFERGQKFLPNLNPDEITLVTIETGDEATRLRRLGEQFVVASSNGYPASNESVNRLIRDILELSLEKEVGESEGLRDELDLTEDASETIKVSFSDVSDKEMVRFLVGKSFEDGSGHYVRRTDVEPSTIYLTSSRVYFSTGDDDFLEKQIVDIKTADLAAVSGIDYRIVQGESETLALADVPSGMKESAKVSQLTSALAGLRFETHFLADAPDVQGLRFDTVVEYDLGDQSGYRVLVAERDEKHYLRIEGFHNAEQVSIARDADEEEVKETADVLTRLDELQTFNTLHGSWIYEINESTADRFQVKKSDLVETS